MVQGPLCTKVDGVLGSGVGRKSGAPVTRGLGTREFRVLVNAYFRDLGLRKGQ